VTSNISLPTTSVLAPLLALLALRLRLRFRLSLQSRSPPVLRKAMIAAESARFFETQSCSLCRYAPVMGCGGGGGGGGLARWGSHVSGSCLLMKPATEAKCASVASRADVVALRKSCVYDANYICQRGKTKAAAILTEPRKCWLSFDIIGGVERSFRYYKAVRNMTSAVLSSRSGRKTPSTRLIRQCASGGCRWPAIRQRGST
jgi:hypothetical protein